MANVPLKGVNLGGWLIIERWMTPSLFKGTSARNEFELARTPAGKKRIRQHHRTFITEDDLRWMKEQGIELLRIPVGYWVTGDDERYAGAIDQLDWIMDASLSYGFKVLLDLHAAPEAQNRAAHSGSGNTMSDANSTKWLNNMSAQRKTIEVLCQLVARYNTSPHLWGFQLLNEPAVDLTGLKLARFYRRAYTAVIKVARPGTRIIFSDAYAPLRLTNCFWGMRRRDYPVMMDCHVYQVFGSHNRRQTFDGHIRRLTWTRRFLRLLSWQQPIVVGEWSAMLPVRTPPDQTRRYVNEQLSAFAPAVTQIYWSYKTEDEGRWNYRDQVEKGLIQ